MNHPLRLRVREATHEDLRAVLDLYAQPTLDDDRHVSLEEAEEIYDQMRAYPDYRLYVAEMDGRVVGTFTMIVMRNLSHCGARSALVESVAVDPAWQGRGVGRHMMHYARERAARNGCYKLALSSNAKREAAHAFYESLGFERHGYSFWVGA